MKKNLFKKMLMVIALSLSLGSYAQRPQFTVCNCAAYPAGSTYTCTYVVRADVYACNSTPSCISLTPITHTIVPGTCAGFAFSVPAGYTITTSSLQFQVTNLYNAATATFTPSSYTPYYTAHVSGNCFGLSGGPVTDFSTGASGSTTYTLCPDIAVGMKPGRRSNEASAASQVSSLKELSEAQEMGEDAFSVFPNPSSDVTNVAFTVKQAQELTIEVYNTLHEKMYVSHKSALASGEDRVSIEGLPSGMYILVFTTANGSTSSKFIVKR